MGPKLEDISPENYKCLKHLDTMPQNENYVYVETVLASETRCIVGEAHNHIPDYKCKECYHYAMKFCDIVGWHLKKKRYLLIKKKYEKLTNEFENHWKDKHGM